jgi:hypothetical protein
LKERHGQRWENLHAHNNSTWGQSTAAPDSLIIASIPYLIEVVTFLHCPTRFQTLLVTFVAQLQAPNITDSTFFAAARILIRAKEFTKLDTDHVSEWGENK